MSITDDCNYCRCCGGSGEQTDRVTGITNKCPCCGGSGRERKADWVIATI